MKRIKSSHHIFFRHLSYGFFWSCAMFLMIVQSCQTVPEEEKIFNTHPVDSLDYYTNLIASRPSEEAVPALTGRARLLYERKAYDAALNDLQSALRYDSTQVELYLLKSKIELDYYRSMDALHTLQQAEKLWPESMRIKEELAKTHLILKQYEEARIKARQALKINPLSAKPYLILGMVAKENQDTLSAIKFLKEAVQNDADLLDGWIELATLQMKNDPSEAAPYFASALQIAPDNIRIWHAYAMYWQDQDSLEQAKNSYAQIIALDSTYVKAYYNKALLLMDQDSFCRAIPLWDQYILLAEDQAQGYYYRGISYEMNQNYPSALENYQNAKILNPSLDNINDAIKSMKEKIK